MLDNLMFGFESEFLFPSKQNSSDERRPFAEFGEKIENYFSQKVTIGYQYHAKNKVYDPLFGQVFDHIEHDGSISGGVPNKILPVTQERLAFNKVWRPCEMVSKTYSSFSHDDPLQSFLNDIEDFFCFLAQNQCITNSSTGFHVTISGFPKDINWLAAMLDFGSDHLLKMFNRSDNHYCYSAVRRGIAGIDLGKWFLRDISNKAYAGHIAETFKYLTTEVRRRSKHSDFHFRNDEKTMLELRSFGGDFYHLRFEDIASSIKKLLRVAEESRSCEFNRNHFRKIYRLSKKKVWVFVNKIDDAVASFRDQVSKNWLKSYCSFLNQERAFVLYHLANDINRINQYISTSSQKRIIKNLLTAFKISYVKRELAISDEHIVAILDGLKELIEHIEKKDRYIGNVFIERYEANVPFKMTIFDVAFDPFGTLYRNLNTNTFEGYYRYSKKENVIYCINAFKYVRKMLSTNEFARVFPINSFLKVLFAVISAQIEQTERYIQYVQPKSNTEARFSFGSEYRKNTTRNIKTIFKYSFELMDALIDAVAAVKEKKEYINFNSVHKMETFTRAIGTISLSFKTDAIEKLNTINEDVFCNTNAVLTFKEKARTMSEKFDTFNKIFSSL